MPISANNLFKPLSAIMPKVVIIITELIPIIIPNIVKKERILLDLIHPIALVIFSEMFMLLLQLVFYYC